MHVIFCSFGNDSVALLQWALEARLENVVVGYSDTGWAAPWWADRIEQCEDWLYSHGIDVLRIPSVGMRALVVKKKAWPRNGMQFCTEELKIKPAATFLDKIDPRKEATCVVGVRREESAKRAQWPEWTYESALHGGRDLWAPLVRFDTQRRDALLKRAGFDVLPHRSMECFPCINANRGDLQLLGSDRVSEIAAFEASLGETSNGKPRTMFRPYRHMDAVGIREVVRWAKSDRGKFKPLVVLQNGGCDSGMCV